MAPPRPASLLASLIEIAQTRLRLAAVELEEERLRIAQLLVLGACAFFFVALGVVALSALLVVAFWETHRLAVLGALAVLYLGAGAWALRSIRRITARRPALFEATFAELQKDADALARRRPRADDDAEGA